MSITVPGQSERDPLRFAAAIRALAEGRSNAVVVATLTPSATATTVNAPNCAEGSAVLASPLTASAAATTGLWFEPKNGAFVVHHNSAVAADRRFAFVAIG